jgi:hypothetical protein
MKNSVSVLLRLLSSPPSSAHWSIQFCSSAFLKSTTPCQVQDGFQECCAPFSRRRSHGAKQHCSTPANTKIESFCRPGTASHRLHCKNMTKLTLAWFLPLAITFASTSADARQWPTHQDPPLRIQLLLSGRHVRSHRRRTSFIFIILVRSRLTLNFSLVHGIMRMAPHPKNSSSGC